MMREILSSTTLAVGLVACGGLVNSGDKERSMEIPVIVRDMIAADFPADGQMHVQKKGNFRISGETMVCRAPREIDLTLEVAAPRLLGPGLSKAGAAVSSGLGGELGEDMGDGIVCDQRETNVITTWVLSTNSDGTPYRIIAAVWQGDPSGGGAVWIGGIERSEGLIPDHLVSVDGPTLDQSPSTGAEQQYRLKMYLSEDSRRLGEAFQNSISGET
jgi:hypothetical protein